MGAMPEQAKVHSINVSNGGVPKLPRSSAHCRVLSEGRIAVGDGVAVLRDEA
jgi:hypothetical protein